jgi:signal transduction histidine kinase
MRVDDLRPLAIFDGLTDGQLAELVAAGHEVAVEPGVVLFRDGEPADFWWLLVEGSIDLLRHIGREDTVVARMDQPGRWAGGFRAWDDHGVYLATARGATPGRVLQVPATVLRERSQAWFPFAGHLIEGLYRTARSIESTARQRDSLVTLGTLAAGLAHELNNPAAAAIRAVDSLEAASDAVVSSVSLLCSNAISPDQFAKLDVMRRAIEPGLAPVDALARSDREQALSLWLSSHGVEKDWLIAPSLAAAGVDAAWCDEAAAILAGPALEPGLEWVANTFAVSTLLSEVKESTRRISELVGAVRSYSQMDRASLQPIDVADGLNSTLVMLTHKIGSGITVVRDFAPDLPVIEAYAGELNQVWTNLIDNALDAMDGTGTLRLSSRLDGESVVVEIADTGAGMPPEVAHRAFEVFFTTKEVGKGTGLGLDIAQRVVVEHHGGEIAIASQPGNTVLSVRLPLRAPNRG